MTATKRENELELEVWRSRIQTVQADANTLNLQSNLLQIRAKECQDNIVRLEMALKAEEKKDAPDPQPIGTAAATVEPPATEAAEPAASPPA